MPIGETGAMPRFFTLPTATRLITIHPSIPTERTRGKAI